MAASTPLLLIAAVALLISPATSQTCKSQTFPQTTTKFTNCMDLPTLKAQLHWSHNPSAKPVPILNIAFVAPPARPDGWVAWALNPTGSGMIGAQALIAFKHDQNGSVVVKTYNISSYGPITESKIAYEVLSKRAEYSNGVMRIFATLALQPGGNAVVNQVWQVGASVIGGVPVKHDMSTENLSSKGTLRLGGTAAEDPAPTPAPVSGGGGGGPSSSGWRVYKSGSGLHGVLVLLWGVVFGVYKV